MIAIRVRRCLALATCAFFTGDQIAWGTAQLAAIRADPDFRGGDYYGGPAPLAGMAIARQIATSWRSAIDRSRTGLSGSSDTPIRRMRGTLRLPSKLSQPLLRLRLQLYRLMQGRPL